MCMLACVGICAWLLASSYVAMCMQAVCACLLICD